MTRIVAVDGTATTGPALRRGPYSPRVDAAARALRELVAYARERSEVTAGLWRLVDRATDELVDALVAERPPGSRPFVSLSNRQTLQGPPA